MRLRQRPRKGGREAALRLPTDRPRTASSSRIECGVRPSRTPSCKSPANPCLEVTRTQGSDSFPSFLPPAVVVQYDHVPDSRTGSAPGSRAAVPSWPLIAQIKKQPALCSQTRPGLRGSCSETLATLCSVFLARRRVFPGQVSLFVHENDQATEGLDAPLFTRKLIRARWTGRQKSRWRWRRSLTL